MIRHIVQCEVCTESFDYNPFENAIDKELPEPWLALFSAGLLHGQQPRHFCSAPCLQKWLSDTYGPTIAEKIKAWEAAHPDVDCTNKIIHPYYADVLNRSLKSMFKVAPPAEKNGETNA